MVETRYAAAVDSYINLGAFYNRTALAPRRRDIIDACDAYRADYPGVYRCLRAALAVKEQGRATVLTDAALTKLEKRAVGVISREFGGRSRRSGKMTKRLLSGVTPKGRLCFYDTVKANYSRIYELDTAWGLSDVFLKKLLAGALASGWDVIACPDPLSPENRLEHLLVPELSAAFVTSGPESAFEGAAYRRLRLDGAIEKEHLAANRQRLRFMQKTARAITGEAVAMLAGIKEKHDVLEAIYNPHVDFDGISALAEDTAAEILNL
ncbi:MAG: hypothetical protein IJP23_05005 [Oscillospiraceae bacterium]|nr:hypothetical protein [Oscillospiraceae bacterium]